MESFSPPPIGILRGLAALLLMNLVNALPTIAGKYFPASSFAIVLLSFAKYGGGMAVAYGLLWIRPSFWLSDAPLFRSLLERVWTFFPPIAIGTAGSIFAQGIFAPGVVRADVWLGILTNALDGLTVILILWSMARGRLSPPVAALSCAFVVTLLLATTLSFSRWSQPEILVNDLALLVGQFLLTTGMLAMWKNVRGAVAVLLVYYFCQVALSSVFAVFWGSYGAAIQQLSVLATAVFLLVTEKRLARRRPPAA